MLSPNATRHSPLVASFSLRRALSWSIPQSPGESRNSEWGYQICRSTHHRQATPTASQNYTTHLLACMLTSQCYHGNNGYYQKYASSATAEQPHFNTQHAPNTLTPWTLTTVHLEHRDLPWATDTWYLDKGNLRCRKTSISTLVLHAYWYQELIQVKPWEMRWVERGSQQK